jgi:hypothetical protein
MFIIPLLIFGLIGVLSATGGTAPPPLPPRRTVTMGDTEDDDTTSEKSKRIEQYLIATMQLSDSREVARRARVIAKQHPDVAKLVMRRARELELAKSAAKAPEAIWRASKTTKPLVPFNLLWTKFLYSIVRDVSDVTNGHVGYFYFSWTRLVALKLATNLRKEGKSWAADIVPPPTLAEFLASSKLQYEAFVKSMLDYLPTLTSPRYQLIIDSGTQINGKRVTLSGLLALAHAAGIDGLKSWLANPDDRAKHPNTTAVYMKSTGIF